MRNYLEECKTVHNNKYDYSLSIFKGLHYKIKIICDKHGEFEQRLDSHLKGSGCKKCHINKIKFIKNENSNHIDECKYIHNNKYGYSLVEYTNLNDNIKIICPIHGIFEQRLSRHKEGSGCQKCFFDKQRLTIENFIEKSNKVHNGKYDYSLVKYINHMTNVKIICSKHGIFEQTPNNHLNGDNCPKCSKNYQLTRDEIINIANIKYNNKYDYTLTIFDNMNQKVKIICPTHGIFEQNIYQHININGCPKCNKRIMNTEHFISLSKNIHNDKYNYDESIFIAMKNKIKIKCSTHGYFYQYPLHHIQGCGCPKCSTRSKGEEIVENLLTKNSIKYETQKKFKECKYKKVLRFDFYLPDINCCIEYDGELHFKCIEYFGGDIRLNENIIKDNIKTKYCEDNNIRLLRIKYDENIENILTNYLKNKSAEKIYKE